MQHRLTEMLQENVKLRETLKQNNESMKQQFNTLAKAKVCRNERTYKSSQKGKRRLEN